MPKTNMTWQDIVSQILSILNRPSRSRWLIVWILYLRFWFSYLSCLPRPLFIARLLCKLRFPFTIGICFWRKGILRHMSLKYLIAAAILLLVMLAAFAYARGEQTYQSANGTLTGNTTGCLDGLNLPSPDDGHDAEHH